VIVMGARVLDGWGKLVVWLPCAAIALCSHHLFSHRLKVTWYVSQDVLLRRRRRRRWGFLAVAVVAAGLAVVSLLFPFMTSIVTSVVLQTAIVVYVATMPPALHPLGVSKGPFVLRGFDEEFGRVWAARLDSPVPSAETD